MHQSQHSRTLSAMAAQQAFLQQKQQQQQQQALQQSPHQPQLLTNPSINPYNLQVVYGNPVFNASLNASALAQAQLQAALIASRTMPPQLMMPWLKVHHDRLEKELHLNQQQALYSALWRNKSSEVRSGYLPYRGDSSASGNDFSSGNTSPRAIVDSPSRDTEKSSQNVIRNDKVCEIINSPKADLVKKYSLSPHTPRPCIPDTSYSNKSDRTPPARGDPLHRPSSPRVTPVSANQLLMKERDKILRLQLEEKRKLEEEQARKLLELEREVKRKEELMKAKYLKSQVGSKSDEQRIDGKVRSAELNHQISKTVFSAHSRNFDRSPPGTIAQTPFSMIDPATYMAVHAPRFISNETVGMSGLKTEERFSRTPHQVDIQRPNPAVDTSVLAEVPMPNGSKIWQPPFEEGSAVSDSVSEKLPKSPKISINNNSFNKERPLSTDSVRGWPYKEYTSTISSGEVQAANPTTIHSAVYNINNLKYSPSCPVTCKTDHSPKSYPDKSVVIKTSPGTSHREGQSVKYISDRDPSTLKHQPSPERLGPLMPDGSRARILTAASLNSLYHFPGPSSRCLAKMNQETGSNPVIINGGHYRVTEVKGSENLTSVRSSPSHVVYKKPAVEESPSKPISLNAPDKSHLSEDVGIRINTQRDLDVSSKKGCHGNRIKFCDSSSPHDVIPNFPTSPSMQPHLRSLAAAGYFNGISGSNVVWGDLSNFSNHNLGAPSKGAVKDALLGVSKETGLNLSISKQPTDHLLFKSDVKRCEGLDVRGSESDKSPLLATSVLASIAENTAVLNSRIPSIKPMSTSACELPPQEHVLLSKINCKPQSAPNTASELDLTTSCLNVSCASPNTLKLDMKSPALHSGSASSECSSIPENSLSSNKFVLTSSSMDVAGTKSFCSKLKKTWLKRMSDGSDDAVKSGDSKMIKRKNSGDSPLSRITDDWAGDAGSVSTGDERDEPPHKKMKKKHKKQDKEKKNKDSTKKKRKHKERGGKKFRNCEVESDSEMPAFPGRTDNCEKITANGRSTLVNVMNNSKLYLLGRFVPSTSSEENDSSNENTENENIKENLSSLATASHRMPLGENGLPMSVLSCKKEQARLRRSGAAFMQDAACHEISAMSGISIMAPSNGISSLPKCRECRSAKRKENNAVFCRFYGFRKLSFVNGQLQAAGFCQPEDCNVRDLSLWLPALDCSTEDANKPLLELETCRYIMRHIGGKFCELVQEEREAISKAGEAGKVNWKRPVHGVREMCDACETTLFNLHWACQRCGFAVCSDCYRIRREMSKEDLESYDNDRSNPHRWIRCNKGKQHHVSCLVPTQIIPSSCLFDLSELAHQARAKWSITSQCRCKKIPALASRSSDPTPLLKNHFESAHNSSKNLLCPLNSTKPESKYLALTKDSPRLKSYECENSASPLDWLASIALRERRHNPTMKNPIAVCDDNTLQVKSKREASKLVGQSKSPGGANTAPRSWFCNGQLLQLTDSKSKVNIDTFQLHWFYGMPVMASGATNSLNRDLWKPEAFSEEYGDQPTGGALVNCRQGSVITNAQLKDFWSGFECIENRLRDERSGEKMILKLKDWPTTDDFIDTMPEKFEDLMQALPLPQYTARNGRYNLAAHLPNFFVRPDLGPKMYIAYGWASEKDWSQGTTNLHLDISDACNLMVYVGIPSDQPPASQDALLKIIKEGDVDDVQIARTKSEKAGALWHIFKPGDADKIRKLILKVKAESGIAVSEDHDPIHDQQIYLDRSLRSRLKEEYGVEGYALVQCEGDSVFIPAGAPHQVFNLHSCIKVAEDFVSPEHVDKCFLLTEEFRHLSTTHSNHEDKLQLKNIIYHTMKEVVSSLHRHEIRGGPDFTKPPPSSHG